MELIERSQQILQAQSLPLILFQRLVCLLHLADSLLQAVGIDRRIQFDKTPVGVIADPVFGTFLSIGFHREQEIERQAAVGREVLIDTFYDKLVVQVIFIADLLAEGAVQVKTGLAGHPVRQFLRKAPAHHHGIRFRQHFRRIAGQDRPVEYLEKAGVCKNQETFQSAAFLVQIDISVEYGGHTGTAFHAGNLMHEAGRNTAADSAPLIGLTVLGIVALDPVDPVGVLVEPVVAEFIEHLGHQHDAHGQPHAQGQHLDQRIFLAFHLSFYSFFNSTAGSACAAFTVCQRTVAKEITTPMTTAAANTHP